MVYDPQSPVDCVRLEALRSYAVLDTEPEQALDDLTALAADICEAPVALISLIDEDRQWFKARIGTELTETSLDLAFCVHGLGQPEMLIVPDATQDERFAQNPLVTGEPGIRFYAGAPLITPEGDGLGTLCVIDYVPRKLSAAQEQALGVLSRQVMANLELRRQLRALQASEAKLRAIFEAEPECVKLLDADGKLHEMNAAGLRIIEADSLETVGDPNLLSLVVPKDRSAVQTMLKAVAHGEKRMVGYRLIGLAGTPRSIEMTGVPFLDAATGQNLVLGVSLDVTTRKLAEFRLHRLNRLHTVLSETGEAILRARDRLELYETVCRITVEDGLLPMALIAEVDPETGRVHRVASHGTGQEYLRELTIATDSSALSHGTAGTALRTGRPDFCNDFATDPRMAPWREDALRHGFRATASFPIKRGELTIGVLVLFTGETGYFQDDEIRLMTAVADNLSFALEAQEREQRRQLAESALRASEQQFASAFQYAAIGVALVAPDGRVLNANRALGQMLGYSDQEMLDRSFQDITSPDDLEADMGNVRRLLAGQIDSYQMEKRYLHRSGQLVWAILSVSLVRDDAGLPVHFIAQIQDISERKRTEEEIRHQADLLRAVTDGTPDSVFVKDLEGRFLLINEAAARLAGRTAAEVLGRDATAVFGAEDARAVMESDQRVMESNRVQTTEEALTVAGLTRTFLSTRVPYRDRDGKVVGLIGVARDITDRKHAEERNAQQAALIDEARDAIFVCNLEHRVTFWSKGAERLFGWLAEDVRGRLLHSLLQVDSTRLKEADLAVREHGHWSGEIEKTARDGSVLTVDARWTLVRDTHGKPQSILNIDTDITERKKIERQFLRAQRMESIGTLAGGIAHDLNNCLGPIMMSLDLLKAKFPDSSSGELLDIIDSSAQRAADMVRQVLTFARGVEGRRTEMAVGPLIREIEKIANDTFLKHIEVRTTLPEGLWTVMADPTQIHQVLLNLCVNARDAMPFAGTLTLAAENVTLDAHYAGLSWNDEAKPGPYVFIQVADTGTGIPSEILEKIFDPFFTTKEIGKGTGLGLSTSMAIVKSHGGFIRVYSEPGKGTKFHVYLPAQTEQSTATMPGPAAPFPRGHGELILVVDDEINVRRITQQTLESYGYHVVVASDGAEAVAVFARRSAEIAAVLTDMMMPVMDGLATINVLRRMSFELPIIATSGLSTNDRIAEAAGLGVKHFLPKPYPAKALLTALREILPGGDRELSTPTPAQ